MKNPRNRSNNNGVCSEVSTHTSAEDPVGVPGGVEGSLILAVSAWCLARRDAHTDKDVFLFDIDVAPIKLGLPQFLLAFLCGGEG